MMYLQLYCLRDFEKHSNLNTKGTWDVIEVKKAQVHPVQLTFKLNLSNHSLMIYIRKVKGKKNLFPHHELSIKSYKLEK